MTNTPLTFKATSDNAELKLVRAGEPPLLNLKVTLYKLDGTSEELTDINPNDYTDINQTQAEVDRLSSNFHFGIYNIRVRKEDKFVIAPLSLQKGQYVTIEGKQSTFSNSENDYYQFSLSGNFDIQGNIMSLVNNAVAVTNPYQFANLFKDCHNINSTPQLPATTLSEGCYDSMFENCYELQTPPKLPANKLTTNCYKEMFRGCVNLTSTPVLPARELAVKCYLRMFEGCVRLKAISQIYAQKFATKSCQFMFWDCKRLRSIKVHFKDWLFNGSNNWMNTEQQGTFYKVNSLPEEYNYNRIPRTFKVVDLNKEPLTFFATKESSIAIVQAGKPNLIDLYYCINEQNKWTKYIPGRKILLKYCDIIQFKNNGPFFSFDQNNFYQFVMTGQFLAYGKVQSLINFRSLTCGCFTKLFDGCDALIQAPTCNSLQLTDRCYDRMFRKCHNLIEPPQLPANKLATKCYYKMFEECTQIKRTPFLLAKKLTNNCYEGMFKDCILLTDISDLPATTLKPECYKGMFAGCKSLTSTPLLPAFNLAYGCYSYMFRGCTSLSTAPQLLATKLDDWCYAGMFWGCTSLINVPILKAVKLAVNCYFAMFHGCTSLTDAPALYASKLVPGCYENMFENCSTLSSVSAYFNYWNEKDCDTFRWLSGVASSGDFYHKDILNTDITRNANTIPSNWTLSTINTDNQNSITFTSIEATSCNLAKVSIRKICNPEPVNIRYRLNNGEWTDYTIGTEITLQYGQSVSFNNNTETFSLDSQNYYKFVIDDGKVTCSGSVNSLLGTDELTPYCFFKLFEYCKSLVSSPELNSLILAPNCYQDMFKNCINLSSIPQLPAVNLAPNCYRGMFRDCNSLSSIELNDSVNQNNCCREMFSSCDKLISAKLPSKVLAPSCYQSMFEACHCLSSVEIGFNYWYDKATTNWLEGVYNSGVMIKPFTLSNDYGPARIPDSWKPQLTEPNSTPLTIVARGEDVRFRIKKTGSPECQLKQLYFRFCNSDWELCDINIIFSLKENQYIQFRNYQYQFSTDRNNYYSFDFEKNGSTIELFGNVMSLVNFSEQITHEYQFAYLFAGCTSITKAPFLPATKLEDCCYYNMFNSCTHLIKAPDLPATTIVQFDEEGNRKNEKKKVYLQMFANCYCLSSIPQLPIQNLTRCCYRGMFRNCINITSAILPATQLYSGCYANMFNGCNSLKYIEVNFKQWSNDSNNPTDNWLSGTCSGGVFVKPNKLPPNDETPEDVISTYFNVNHIPWNWTVSGIITPEPQPEPTPDPDEPIEP